MTPDLAFQLACIVFAVCVVTCVAAVSILRRRRKPTKHVATLPKPNATEIKLMGFKSPDDATISIPKRDVNAIKLALWRSREGWDIAWRQAEDIIRRCRHLPHCPGETSEIEPCEPGCPDRQFRMSALVILNAARMFAPVDAKRLVNAPYFAPSRERYSEVLAELALCQAELEAGGKKPPPNEIPANGPAPPDAFKLPQELVEEFARIETETKELSQ